jgi:membrane protein implicated in regulation of membrane protease activity
VPDWAIWLIIAAVLVGVEVFSISLFFGPLAVAALLAGVAAALGLGITLQLIVFVAASIASLAVLRPIARSHLRTPTEIRTGTAALVGGTAVVLERVDENGGKVKIGGEVWSARPYDDSSVYEAGQRVSVLEIKGATALVAE